MKNKKLVMIPGPSPVTRAIQDQMGRETIAFGDPEFVADFKGLIADMKDMFGHAEEVFVLAGTGTMAMEAAIANTTKRGDSILVVSNGYFGDRFIGLCEKKGLKVDVLQAPWGQAVTPGEIDKKLAEKPYAAVTVSHVDTSTGTCAPIEEIGKVLAKYPNTLYIVDGVCATGGQEERMDWNIDIILSGSQKAFGVSPGIAMLWVSSAAMARRKELGTIPEYYIDFENWVPIMHDPSKYFATPAVNMIWAMKEAVRIIKEEGLENRYARHEKNAAAMRAAFQALGFTILAEEGKRAVTLSNLLYPAGVADAAFRKALMDDGVAVGGGLGAYAGKMFRIGHMGNIDMHDMVSAVAAVERALYLTGGEKKFGVGIAALTEVLI